jgi:SWI/SNF-related matrix-associated actin-dependent regulator 1 of chromatin subfamily A
MYNRDRFGLHDEMGIGKTATTIGAIDKAGARRGIVVCPAMLRENWIKEFRKFSKVEHRICKGRNIHDYIAWSRGRFDILVTSYEQATKWTPQFIRDGEFIDFLAFDEAHYLKNVEAGRTRALLGFEASGQDGMLAWAERAWHVTGTPMANDPMDIYTFLRFSKAIDMTPAEFTGYFFEKRVGSYSTRHFPKDDMLPALQGLIYNNSIRRTHQDVGMQLPPIHLTEMLLEGKTIDLQKAMEAYPNLEKSIIEAIQEGRIENLDAAYIAVLRRLLGKAKAVPYVELLKSEMDAGAGKRVIFCWHTEPLLYVQRAMKKYGYNFGVVYGGSTDRDAEAAIHAHQTDPNCHGTILNIKKGGTGLTLIEGNDIDILESDWSPAGNAQALKRVHRYGQKHAVQGRFITLANSFDVAVNRIVADKTASIAAIEGHSMSAAPA